MSVKQQSAFKYLDPPRVSNVFVAKISDPEDSGTQKMSKSRIVIHISSWWFQPIWKIFVKLDHFPRDRGKNKNVWNHLLDLHYASGTRTALSVLPVLWNVPRCGYARLGTCGLNFKGRSGRCETTTTCCLEVLFKRDWVLVFENLMFTIISNIRNDTKL